jgi:hypothetical protein
MDQQRILKPGKPVAEITITMDSNGQADVRAFDVSGARIQNGVIIPGRVKMPPLNCAALLSQVLSGIMVGIMSGLAQAAPEGNSNNGDNKETIT